MKKFLSFFAATLLFSQAVFAVSSQPYLSVNVLPQTPYFLPNAWMITDLLTNNNGTVFVDVGSSGGSAARYVALSAAAGTQVYSVDSWKGSTSFQQFLSNVIQDSTDSIVVPLRLSWKEGADALNLAADVIYINTDNPSTITNTILGWFPHLNANGAIAGDNWNNPEVELSVVTASAALGFSVNVSGTFWWINN